MNLEFKDATIDEVPLVLSYIQQIAAYEKMSDAVVATEDLLREWIFEKEVASVFFVVYEKQVVGFALYFYNFSTFVGKAGLYLEDVYIKPEFRGKGLGKAVLKELARRALEKGCGRMEWTCLNWNTPSIRFYESLGAIAMDEWTTYRLTEESMKSLIK